jgi:hypothetical protein
MVYEYQLTKLLIITAFVLVTVLSLRKLLHNPMERQFLYFMSIGVYVWSGMGGTIGLVGWEYLWMFCGFFMILVGSFTLSLFAMNRFWKLGEFDSSKWMLNEKFWQLVIVGYLLFSLFPLAYPEMKLMLLIRPPAPDLVTNVENRFQDAGSTLPEVLYYYLSVMTFPFFLFSLSALGRRWILLIVVLLLYNYIKYCSTAYMSRHEMGMILLMIFLYLWNWKIIPRQIMIIGAAACLPLLIFFFNIYTSIRLGAGIETSFGMASVISSVIELFYAETFYPILVYDLLLSDHSQEIFRYIIWIISLPIPSQLTAGWDILRINREYTEFITGGVYGENQMSIILPGLLGEAIYIFGQLLWWVHAVSVGSLFAFLCYILRADFRLFFVMTYFQLQAIILARGGASMFLILIINYMILFWPFLIFLFWFAKKRGPKMNMPKQDMEMELEAKPQQT